MKNSQIRQYAEILYKSEQIMQSDASYEEKEKAEKEMKRITFLLMKDMDALLKVNEILEKKFDL